MGICWRGHPRTILYAQTTIDLFQGSSPAGDPRQAEENDKQGQGKDVLLPFKAADFAFLHLHVICAWVYVYVCVRACVYECVRACVSECACVILYAPALEAYK